MQKFMDKPKKYES